MNKIFFFFISILVFDMLIVSCTKDNVCYSCDVELDNWAKENLKEIRAMSTEEWFELDYKYSRPAYVALRSNSKFRIWEVKLKDVLRYDWNNDEESHIKSLLRFATMNKRIFRNDFYENSQLVSKAQLFLDNWVRYATDSLRWSKELVYAISADPHLIADTKGGMMIKNNGIELLSRPIGGDTDLLKCNCNLSSMWYLDCKNDPCEKTVRGCGTLLLFKCNGRHNLGTPPDPTDEERPRVMVEDSH